MVDAAALKFIGVLFAGITLAVALTGAVVVKSYANAGHAAADHAAQEQRLAQD